MAEVPSPPTRQGRFVGLSSYGFAMLLLGLQFTPYATHLLTFLVPSLVLGICHFVALRIYLRR